MATNVRLRKGMVILRGALTGLKSLKKLVEDGANARVSDFLKLKDGQSVTLRFLQELDESGKMYDESRGLAITVFEHKNPNDFSVRFLCTREEEGYCVGCEMAVADSKWRRRPRLFINAYIAEEKAVKVLATGFSARSLGGTLIEYAEEFGTICDRNYKLKRIGEGLSTHYTLTPREVSPFDFDKAKLVDLSTFAKYLSYDECKELVANKSQNDQLSTDW